MSTSNNVPRRFFNLFYKSIEKMGLYKVKPLAEKTILISFMSAEVRNINNSLSGK